MVYVKVSYLFPKVHVQDFYVALEIQDEADMLPQVVWDTLDAEVDAMFPEASQTADIDIVFITQRIYNEAREYKFAFEV